MKLSPEALQSAATCVLEDVACVLVRPLDRRPPTLDTWSATGARLRFRGAVRGYMELWAPRDAIRALASAVLGDDGGRPATAEATLDALREMLHVLCGDVLAVLAGPERPFSLGVPRGCARPVPFTHREDGIETWLEAEGHPVLMRLRVAGLGSLPAGA
jgi:hypothetical protein